jgi:hypothetical protein
VGTSATGAVDGWSRSFRTQILHLIAMLECLLLPERALKEGKTFSDMAQVAKSNSFTLPDDRLREAASLRVSSLMRREMIFSSRSLK